MQFELGCAMNAPESIFVAFVIIGCNCIIVTKIVLLLRRVMAALPEDMDNARKVKRHYKFVTWQTLMFMFGGLFCWGIFIFVIPWHDSYVANFVFFSINPLQGLLNLLVYVAPSHLHKCSCSKGNSK